MGATEHVAGEREVIRALFAALDRGDIPTLSSYLHDDVIVILSNQEPIYGAAAFAELYEQVSGTLAGLRHEIHDVWSAREDSAVWTVRMTVHYTRLDGTTVSLPCCNVLRFAEDLVSEYQVFMDMTPVFA
jgi:ketosteroid isomerase-like protein